MFLYGPIDKNNCAVIPRYRSYAWLAIYQNQYWSVKRYKDNRALQSHHLDEDLQKLIELWPVMAYANLMGLPKPKLFIIDHHHSYDDVIEWCLKTFGYEYWLDQRLHHQNEILKEYRLKKLCLKASGVLHRPIWEHTWHRTKHDCTRNFTLADVQLDENSYQAYQNQIHKQDIRLKVLVRNEIDRYLKQQPVPKLTDLHVLHPSQGALHVQAHQQALETLFTVRPHIRRQFRIHTTRNQSAKQSALCRRFGRHSQTHQATERKRKRPLARSVVSDHQHST